MPTPEYVCRFRSVDRLLGESRELERQEIYLSDPQQLNDPMEGYQDVLWRGDEILWENLLRHYLLSLLWSTAGCLLMEDASFKEPKIPATLTEADLPTDAFRAMYHDVCDRFFEVVAFTTMPAQLAKIARPLRIDGLCLVLSLVHLSAFSCVIAGANKHGLAKGWSLPPPEDLPKVDDTLIALGERSGELEEGALETLAFATNKVREQRSLGLLFSAEESTSSALNSKKNFLLFDFPDRYAKGLSESLIHPDWYTACFSANCTNASMWSSYADQHRGVALMFRPEEDKQGRPCIALSGAIGFNSSRSEPETRPIMGPMRGVLHKVQYSLKPPEIDFFQFLGRLPRPKLFRTWHANRAGEQSPLVGDIDRDEKAWRDRLWASFYRMATTKLEDWKHEEEYRMVFADSLGVRREHRTVRYDLSHLTGIVFGLRTPTEHKIEIMKLIHRKCKSENRTAFTFDQMTYRANQGRLIKV